MSSSNNKRPPSSPIVAPAASAGGGDPAPEGPPAKLPRLEGPTAVGEEARDVKEEAPVENPPPIAADGQENEDDDALPPPLGPADLPEPLLSPLKAEEAPAALTVEAAGADVDAPQDAGVAAEAQVEETIQPEEEGGVDAETADALHMAVDAIDAAEGLQAAEVGVADVEGETEQFKEEGVADAGEETKDAAAAGAADAEGMAEVAKAEEGVYDPGIEDPPLVVHAPPPKKPKKERKEFTAQEKLRIIQELDAPNPPTVQSVLEKYGISKSSLHRWRQLDRVQRLHEIVANERSGNALRTKKDGRRYRDMTDKIVKVKRALQHFCEANLQRPEDERLAITSGLIKLKAAEIKADLLRQHAEAPDVLTDVEAEAIANFKGSKSWACIMGNQLGYLHAPHAIQFTAAAKKNTEAYLAQCSDGPKPPKKQRMEFTAGEKLAILRELEDTNVRNRADGVKPLTVDEICHKYGTSKSSLHRWKQQHRAGRLVELAAPNSGHANSKRVFHDRLLRIKQKLHAFYEENAQAAAGHKVTINYTTLQARAVMAKDALLERHYRAVQRKLDREAGKDVEEEEVKEVAKEVEAEADAAVETEAVEAGDPTKEGEDAPAKEGEGAQQGQEEGFAQVLKVEGKADDEADPPVDAADGLLQADPDILPPEDVKALVNFKGSNSWLRETARKFGWKLDADKREAAAPPHAGAAPPAPYHPGHYPGHGIEYHPPAPTYLPPPHDEGAGHAAAATPVYPPPQGMDEGRPVDHHEQQVDLSADYDAQGNMVVRDIMEDPLVHVEVEHEAHQPTTVDI